MSRPPRFDILGLVISPIEVAGLSALGLTVFLAFWRGGPTERRIAVVIGLAWLGSMVADFDGWRGVQWGIFAIDLVLAVWLTAEFVLGRRLWTAFAAGAQIMIVMTHIAFAFSPGLQTNGFFSAYYLWSYVLLFTLAVGSVTSRKPVARTPSEAERRP